MTSEIVSRQSTPAFLEKQVLTRRLFLIFVMFALIPVIVLSTVAIRYISTSSQEQLQSVLTAQSDTFSDRLLSRLAVLERRLELFQSEVNDAKVSEFEVWLERKSFGDQSVHMARMPFNFLPRGVDEKKLAHLSAGRTLLISKTSIDVLPEVFMVRAIAAQNLSLGLAVSTVATDFLLGAPDSRNLTQENCVFGRAGSLLFATRLDVCKAFGTENYQYRGLDRRTLDGSDLTLTYRSIFLSENFRSADWRAGIVTRDADTRGDYAVFRNSFIAFAVLALLTLSFLSMRLIRRQMSPLEAIMSGISRVSEHQYDQPVTVDSGDEFEAMAGAFNTMSERVSRQLATMSSMSEIDQLILSRGKKEDIVRIVLAKTRTVLPGDHFALLLLNNDSGGEVSLYREKANDTEVEIVDTTLSEQEAHSIQAKGIQLCSCTDQFLPVFVRSLIREGDSSIELLPIALNGQLIAVLSIAFGVPPAIDQERKELASSYGDRIAVALANAEWEEKLFHQANFDSLTELPNRPALVQELRRRIVRARRERSHFAVVFVDLDNFKLVNDSLGHDRGDQLIVQMADRLASGLRENDMVARLGGDEFVVICSESPTQRLTASSVSEVANRLLSAIKKPVVIDGRELRVEASMGAALFPSDGDDAETLMRHADTAMYHAKDLGRARYQFFSEDLNRTAAELMELSTQLKQALERDEFILHFQPKVCAKSYRIVGAEALLRWDHPNRGFLPPSAFIPAAETLGLMDELGKWVLKAACSQISQWHQMGIDAVPISVNVVPSQIQHRDFVSDLQTQLKQYDLQAKELELEITENALVSNVKETVATLERVREMGAHVSIDDYGTGYSSMSYMKQLPADKLKIDRCFITDLASDASDKAIVSSTILLAKSLNMRVVAEGVESLEQLNVLRECGCDEIQGFYFSKPLPADRLISLISDGAFVDKRPPETNDLA